MGSSVKSIVKTATNPVAATKQAVKAGASAVKETVKAATNPVAAVKETIKNPIGQALKFTGGDVILGLKGGGTTSQPTVNETAEYQSGTNEDATAQERARMISRQSAQGANPIMLLGQDFQDTAINHEEKLGGRER